MGKGQTRPGQAVSSRVEPGPPPEKPDKVADENLLYTQHTHTQQTRTHTATHTLTFLHTLSHSHWHTHTGSHTHCAHFSFQIKASPL